MGRILNDMFDDDDPKDLYKQIVISLLYYEMMHINKVTILEKIDIKLNMTEDADVNLPAYTTKYSTKG